MYSHIIKNKLEFFLWGGTFDSNMMPWRLITMKSALSEDSSNKTELLYNFKTKTIPPVKMHYAKGISIY